MQLVVRLSQTNYRIHLRCKMILIIKKFLVPSWNAFYYLIGSVFWWEVYYRFFAPIFLVLQSNRNCFHNSNKPTTITEKPQDRLRWMLLGCEMHHSPAWFIIPSLSEAWNCSVTNSGMSLPVSRKQPARRQDRPNTSFRRKEPLTCVQPPITITRMRL